ncbi:uncharacterized protein L203_103146 [Cryptococcus depauperatus CBS 7841]|uniref:Actin cytoskeleton-regulatory complex protein SLA1 n=1 Tax=Cryptococcus depauperatus CBS 7841 TaxID=1295531 RepID=A0A1E3IPD5_9TREE|nr:hypothetical protein L203_01579 [Cryptococcus depauperatus CBS 7841]
MAYVAVAKALYDYTPQDPETELAFAEDQILYIIDKEDDEWWKSKLKDDNGGTGGGVGLVPANYVEEIPPLTTTRAMFAYDSTSPEELSMSDESVIHVYSIEEEWLLVQLDGDHSRKLGFVPKNYCEPLDSSEQVQVADAAEAEAEIEAQRRAEKERELEEKKRQLKLKDKVETWSVNELDGKKKKKGTLGVGNAAVFFASDTDKAAPVKQFPITDLISVSQSSSKTLSLQLSSLSKPLELHCGNSDTAKAILAKFEQSKAAAGEALELLNDEQMASSEDERPPTPTMFAPPPTQSLPATSRAIPPESKGVHFAPRPHSETATVLYDFDAAGDDELTVKENDVVIIVDKENDEWWLVKDSKGYQGVIPAAYVQLGDAGAMEATDVDDERDVEAEKEVERQREAAAAAQLEAEHQRQLATEQEERRRIQAAAEERRRQEEEDRRLALQIEEEQRERAARKATRQQEEERRKREEQVQRAREEARAGGLRPPEINKRPSGDNVTKAARNLPSRSGAAPARPPENSRPKPNPAKIRIWSDKTGQFNVEAEYLGLFNGKVRLHKLNGVIIDVPMEKMSARDSELIRRHEAKKTRMASMDEDNVPLGVSSSKRSGQKSTETMRRAEEPIPIEVMRASKASANRRPPFDWFEFFLSAGCDMDDCTRYASNFERDRIDEMILPDLDNGTLRSLGLREGDVIRVRKIIQAKFTKKTPEQEKQMAADEDYARQLQEYEKNDRRGSTTAAPPGLFTGPNGKLSNNTRRGRPEKKSTGPESMDPAALVAATDKLSKTTLSPSPPSAPTPPPVNIFPSETEPKKLAAVSGFDDDAWTIKPASKPASPSPAAINTNVTTSSLSVPSAPPAPASASSPKVASSTDSLIAQINALRPPSTGASQNNTGGSFEGLSGMVGLPTQVPTQQTLQPQQTAQLPQQIQGNTYRPGAQNTNQPIPILNQPTGMPGMSNGARGPLAPVPANQALLNPMQSQATGMFVPTHNIMSPLRTQPTGFPPQQPQMMPQQTGFGGQMGMQPNYTGFSGIQPQQTTFNVIASIPPPQIQPQSSGGGGDKFAPSNIFAAMKKTDFGKPEEQQPQSANKYDALRPLATGYNGAPGGMMAQPTGMYPQQTGMPMGGMMPQLNGMPMQGMMPQMTGFNPNMIYQQQQGQGGFGYR